MKKDVFNHGACWLAFKEQLTPKYLEEGLTKENSKLYIQYLTDMEKGVNIPKNSPKGARNIKTLNRLRSKVRSFLKLLQNNKVSDVTKITSEQVITVFSEWNKNHTTDYARRFKAFWNWWATKNRREGKVVKDVTIDLNTAEKKSERDSKFVWITKKEFDKFRSYFSEDKQVILLFCFDTIIRAPTEIMSLKVENIFEKNDEVWVDIPNTISKTVGRKFNLVYAGNLLLDYIKRNEKKQGDYLFEFRSPMLNKEMQKVAKQLWQDKKSEGGEYFENITLYDMRHSGAIHFRQLFQKTGQSLDILRERGGWSDFKMINYYTKRLGLDGHIQKDKLLLQEDKTKIENEIESLKKQMVQQREDLFAWVAAREKKTLLIAEKALQQSKDIEKKTEKLIKNQKVNPSS